MTLYQPSQGVHKRQTALQTRRHNEEPPTKKPKLRSPLSKNDIALPRRPAKRSTGGRGFDDEQELGEDRMSVTETPPESRMAGDSTSDEAGNRQGRTRSNRFRRREDTDEAPARYYGIKNSPKYPQAMGDLLEIFETGTNGRGVRTTRDNIPQGTILYTEKVTIAAPSFNEPSDDEKFKHRIRDKVATLPLEQLSTFVGLSHIGGEDNEETRFNRNAFEHHDPQSFSAANDSFEADVGDVESIYMLWLNISMLNHSCRPNAVMLIRDPDMGIAEIIAAVNIPVKGTEVTISYIRGSEAHLEDPYTEARKEALLNSWLFHCSCVACEDPVQHDTVNTRRMSVDHDIETSSCCSSLSVGSSETSDERLEYLHQVGRILGLIHNDECNYDPPSMEIFDRWFSQYEIMLQRERMIHRLCDAHEKAVDVYRSHFSEASDDDLTYAKILYHREELIRYTRMCYGLEEAQKWTRIYLKELERNIARPKGPKDAPKETYKSRKRMLPIKAMPSQVGIPRNIPQTRSRTTSSSVKDNEVAHEMREPELQRSQKAKKSLGVSSRMSQKQIWRAQPHLKREQAARMRPQEVEMSARSKVRHLRSPIPVAATQITRKRRASFHQDAVDATSNGRGKSPIVIIDDVRPLTGALKTPKMISTAAKIAPSNPLHARKVQRGGQQRPKAARMSVPQKGPGSTMNNPIELDD